MMYNSVHPMLVGDANIVIKVPELTCTEHQIQISTAVTTGTIAIHARSVMATDYGLIETITLTATPPVFKQFSGAYESIKLVPSTGIAATAVYACWSWF